MTNLPRSLWNPTSGAGVPVPSLEDDPRSGHPLHNSRERPVTSAESSVPEAWPSASTTSGAPCRQPRHRRGLDPSTKQTSQRRGCPTLGLPRCCHGRVAAMTVLRIQLNISSSHADTDRREFGVRRRVLRGERKAAPSREWSTPTRVDRRRDDHAQSFRRLPTRHYERSAASRFEAPRFAGTKA